MVANRPETSEFGLRRPLRSHDQDREGSTRPLVNDGGEAFEAKADSIDDVFEPKAKDEGWRRGLRRLHGSNQSLGLKGLFF